MQTLIGHLLFQLVFLSLFTHLCFKPPIIHARFRISNLVGFSSLPITITQAPGTLYPNYISLTISLLVFSKGRPSTRSLFSSQPSVPLSGRGHLPSTRLTLTSVICPPPVISSQVPISHLGALREGPYLVMYIIRIQHHHILQPPP